MGRRAISEFQVKQTAYPNAGRCWYIVGRPGAKRIRAPSRRRRIDRPAKVAGNEFFRCNAILPSVHAPYGPRWGIESGESSVSEETVESTPEQASQRFEHCELPKGADGNRSSWVEVQWA
jgi:hypothetical protein